MSEVIGESVAFFSIILMDVKSKSLSFLFSYKTGASSAVTSDI